MIDHVRSVLASQYVAAIRMVRDAAAACPSDRWADPVVAMPFGRVAYHTLFFTDLYLAGPAFAVGDVHRAGGDPRQGGDWPGLSQAETLAYADRLCRTAADVVAAETAESLGGPTGFPWQRFTRGELHVYNIRHAQHHAGAMAAFVRRLGVGAGGPDPMDWVDAGDWRPWQPTAA